MWEIIWIPKSRLKFKWTFQTTQKSLQIQRSENHKVGHQKKLILPSSRPLAMRTSDLLTNFALLPSPQHYSLCGAWPSPCSCSCSPWAMAVAPHCAEHSPTAPPTTLRGSRPWTKRELITNSVEVAIPFPTPRMTPPSVWNVFLNPSTPSPIWESRPPPQDPLLWEAFLTPIPSNGTSASQCPYSPCASRDLYL